jgi:CelD/BcsL family acetyltransferase involved in cellulose biosynthesis
MSELAIEEFGTPEALERLGPEWQALAAAHGRGLPFPTFEWLSLWWKHFAEHRAQVRDDLFVRAFRNGAGELVGVAPMMITRRPGVGPLAFRMLDFFGTDPYVTELRGLLCHPEWEGRVTRALLDHLAARASAWDWIHWRGLREGSEAFQILSARPDVTLQGETPDYLLRPAGTWEEFKSSRGRNLKESLRKCYNSLKRDGHAFSLEVAASRDEVRAAVERFLALHGARAEVTGTVAHGNVFESPSARAFLFEVCDRFAARDMARIFQLRVAEKVVACRIGFALGDSLYLYFSGYDPEWAKYSVMTTTVAEAIRWAQANRFAVVNLSFGTDVSKTRWDPEKVVYRNALQASPGVRGRLAHLAYDTLRERIFGGAAGRAVRRLLGRQRASAADAPPGKDAPE